MNFPETVVIVATDPVPVPMRHFALFCSADSNERIQLMTRKPPYPWGKETPGARMRSTAAKARAGLEAVETPGFGDIDARVSRAVSESRTLLESLEHLARAGFRSRAGETPIPAAEIKGAADAVRDAVVAMADASVVNVSERYAAYTSALDVLLGLVDAAQRRGIAGSGEPTRADPWTAFKR